MHAQHVCNYPGVEGLQLLRTGDWMHWTHGSFSLHATA